MSVTEANTAPDDENVRTPASWRPVRHEGPLSQREQLDQGQSLFVQVDPALVTPLFVGLVPRERPGLESGPALEIGLVNRVVPEEDCFEAALSMARSMAANDTVAVTLTKQAINRSFEVMGMRQALLQALELDVLAEASDTPGSREFNEILAKEGSRAAITWREARLAKDSGDA